MFPLRTPQKAEANTKSDILDIVKHKVRGGASTCKAVTISVKGERGRKEPQTVHRTEGNLSQASEEFLSTLPVRGVPWVGWPVLVPPPSSVITREQPDWEQTAGVSEGAQAVEAISELCSQNLEFFPKGG